MAKHKPPKNPIQSFAARRQMETASLITQNTQLVAKAFMLACAEVLTEKGVDPELARQAMVETVERARKYLLPSKEGEK